MAPRIDEAEDGPPRVWRESTWPPLLHVLLWGSAGFGLLAGVDPDFPWVGPVLAAALAIVSLADLLTRRRVEIGPDGIRIDRVLLPWRAIERHAFRELPPVKAGLLLRLTDPARRELGRGDPRHRDERGELYDLYLRARGERLEEWFEVVSLYRLVEDGERLRDAAEQLIELAREVCRVEVVTGGDPLTVSVQVASLDALRDVAAIVKEIPAESRWDPAFDGGVMLLVGPLALADEEGAEDALVLLREAVAEGFAGDPEVEAIFAEPRRG